MVSISWVIGFFLFGGLAGLVIGALMGMAAREAERSLQEEQRSLQFQGAVRELGPATLT